MLRFRNTIAQRIQEGLDLPEWQLFVRDHLRELIQRLGPRNHELFPEGGDAEIERLEKLKKDWDL